MTHHLVTQGETIGSICALHNISRAALFRGNPFLRGRLISTPEGILSAEIYEGERLHLEAMSSRQQLASAAASGTSYDLGDGDISDADELVLHIRDSFPIFAFVESAAEEGLSSQEFVDGLSADGVIAIGVLCTFAASIIGKIAAAKLTNAGGAAVAAMLSGACAYLGKVLSANVSENKPQPGSGTPAPPPPSCGIGEKFFAEYQACGAENAFFPCQDGNGFFSFQGGCIACPDGQSYDQATRACKPGCPPGQPLVHGLCLLPDYSTRCTLQDGSRGVKMSSALPCSPDGCEEGMIYDFASETCVPEGKVERISAESQGQKKFSWFPVLATGGLLLGLGWLAWSRQDHSAPSA